MDTETNTGPAKARYEQLANIRRPYLDRARLYATLTIPYLMPPEGHNETSELPTPYQSVGSMGVNTLASKLVLSVFPTNSLFFRLDIDDNTEDELKAFAEEAGIDPANVSQEIRENLAKTERVAQKWLEGTALRVVNGVLMKHLISSGSYLVQCDMAKKEPVVRGFRMDQYVSNTSPEGQLLELIIKEMVDPETLDEEFKKTLNLNLTTMGPIDRPSLQEMYTGIKLEGKTYKVHQEINGVLIPGSEGSYPKDRLPYLPLVWERESGEQYGRSYIEQYVGDLISAEGLSKALYDAAAVSSKVVFLNNPNGMTKTRTVNDAENGAIVSGRPEDIQAMQVGKMNDLQIAKAQLGDIIQRLNSAFISQNSIQRQAERVTAEEIRMMAEMLEQQMGGVYSRFSREYQRPLADLVLRSLESSKRIQPIPQDSLKVQIITGIDALGRGQELQALRGAITDVFNVMGPEAVQGMHPSELVSQIFSGWGANPTGIVKTPQELQAEREAAEQAQQEQQAAEMAASVAPQILEGQQAEQAV